MSNRLALVVQFSSIDNLSGALRNIMGLGRGGATALRGLQGEARRLKGEMVEAARAIEAGSGNVTQLINRERALAAELAGVNRQLERQRGLMAIDARADAQRARGQALQQRGMDNITTGATLIAPLILATRAAGQFSSGMVDLQQKAGLTNRQTDLLAASILRTARVARQLPEDVRAGVDVLAGFGLDPRVAQNMMTPIARLSTAMKVEIPDAAAAAFANMQNLRVAVSDTGRALDIMATAGNAGAFEVRDMARHFPGLTAQLNALGESGLGAVGNLSAALQMARRATGTSDEAANNVQNLLAKINSPATIRAFQRNFGVDLPAAMARLRAEGMDTFEAIATVTNQATDGDLSRLGFAFEDMQAQSAIRAMIMNLEDYRRIRDQAMAGGGTVDRAFDQRVARDATVQWRSFMASVSSLAIVLGTTLLPAMTGVVDKLTAGVRWIDRWAQANPEAAGAIMSTVTSLLALRIGLGAAQYAIGGLFGPLATMYRLFARARQVSLFARTLGTFANFAIRAAPMLMRAFGMIRIAVMFLARGIMQAGLMLLANPVVLAITAIVLVIAGAGYLIWRHWDTIKLAFQWALQFLSDSWQRLKTLILRFPAAFGPLGFVARFIIQNWATIRAAFVVGWNAIAALVPRFLALGREIVNGLVAGITGNPRGVWNALRNIVMMGINNFRDMLGIRSPSRLFMALGGHMTDGLALGLDRGGRRPLDSLRRLSAGVAGGLSVATLAAAPATASGLSAGPGAAGGAVHIGQLTIELRQLPGEDAGDLARRLMEEIARINGRNGRGGYDDR